MITFLWILSLVGLWLWLRMGYEMRLEQKRRELERERKMRLVAEVAIEAMAEAWAEQFAINRYRVSEAHRAIRKSPRGGPTN